MLEKMAAFFEARLDGYDAHMLKNIESSARFYDFTARQLPTYRGARILDLGCGTGLELEFYFRYNADAKVTGIDLSQGMLDALRAKFTGKSIELVCGSYFDVPFADGYDAAVSVESLHHFTKEAKIPLYRRINGALSDGGSFILTDYFSLSEEEEQNHFAELRRLKAEQGINDSEFYHYDTPLTVDHETEALKAAGFRTVEVLKSWGATYTLKATK